MIREKLYFTNSRGDRLCSILTSLDDPTSPIVLLAHGFASTKDRGSYLDLEKRFIEKGIAVFRFDFHGHGESAGKFEELTISQAADDILNAILFVKKKGYQKIALVGSSFGGMASILAAAKSKDLFVLALKCPVSDYLGKIISNITHSPIQKWKEKGFMYYTNKKGEKLKLNYSFFEDAEKAKTYEEAAKITIPTLIVHGDKDKNVPLEQSKKLAKIIKNSKLEIIKGADHFFSKPEEFDKAHRLIVEFVVKQLKK